MTKRAADGEHSSNLQSDDGESQNSQASAIDNSVDEPENHNAAEVDDSLGGGQSNLQEDAKLPERSQAPVEENQKNEKGKVGFARNSPEETAHSEETKDGDPGDGRLPTGMHPGRVSDGPDSSETGRSYSGLSEDGLTEDVASLIDMFVSSIEPLPSVDSAAPVRNTEGVRSSNSASPATPPARRDPQAETTSDVTSPPSLRPSNSSGRRVSWADMHQMPLEEEEESERAGDPAPAEATDQIQEEQGPSSRGT